MAKEKTAMLVSGLGSFRLDIRSQQLAGGQLLSSAAAWSALRWLATKQFIKEALLWNTGVRL